MTGPDGPLTRLVFERELFRTGDRPVTIERVVPRGPRAAQILSAIVPWLAPWGGVRYRVEEGRMTFVPDRVRVSCSATLIRALSRRLPAGAGVVVAHADGRLSALAGARSDWAGDFPAGATLAPAVLASAMGYGVSPSEASLAALGRRLGASREQSVADALGLDDRPAQGLPRPRLPDGPSALFAETASASLLTVADAYLPFAAQGKWAPLTLSGSLGRGRSAAEVAAVGRVASLFASVAAGPLVFRVWAPPGEDRVAVTRLGVVVARGVSAAEFRRILAVVGASRALSAANPG